eukprot:gene5279-biopygen639
MPPLLERDMIHTEGGMSPGSSVEHLIAALLALLDERRVLHLRLALAGDVEDLLLVLLHPRNVVLQRGELVATLRRVAQ